MMGNTSVEAAQSVPLTAGASSASAQSGAPFWEPLVRACVQMTPTLRELLHQFWGVPVRLAFMSASTKMHYFWRAEDFHVSQLVLAEVPEGSGQEPPMALLRLSEAACSALLTRVLGARLDPQKSFSFKQLSSLEATILNEFSRDLLADFMKNLVKKPAKLRRSETVHLVWTLQLEERLGKPVTGNAGEQPLRFAETFEVGKIILSLPLNAVRIDLPPHADGPAPETVVDTFFYHVKTDVRLFLGSTRIPLSDLHQLEPGDLVVLENSHAERMAVVNPETGDQLSFGADIRQKHRITIPYTQELAMTETQQAHPVGAAARQTLWDNLMIEVNAEFSPIKMPLKQLRQMSEGLVVEMDDLIHNRIALQVEGKTLAWGELVIVGDKFAVRVSQVIAEGADAEMVAEAPAAQPEPVYEEENTDMVAMAEEGLEGGVDGEENSDTFLSDDFDESFDEEDWL